MHAIILAAGVGNRLEGFAQGRPKCLLEFGGETLLARHLRNLGRLGIDDVAICTGHESSQVEAAIDTSLARRVHCRYNPDFREGSCVSLWTMRDDLRAGEDILLMDADVLYAPAILERLVVSPVANCFLLDREFEDGEEPMKICVDAAGRMVEFRKQIAPEVEYNLIGESVGFFRFTPDRAARIAARSEAYVEAGRRAEHYEEILRDELLADPDDFGFEDVTGSPWIEIDFPADVERARNEILPKTDGS